MIIITTEYNCHEENYEKIIDILKQAAFSANNRLNYYPNFNIGIISGAKIKVFLYQEFRSQKQYEKFIHTETWINSKLKLSKYISWQEQKRWEKVTIKPALMTV